MTPALAPMPCLHVGAVMALSVTLLDGMFPQGICRGAALQKFAITRRWPAARWRGDGDGPTR